MTAQEIYITGVLEAFSTFCESNDVSVELTREGNLLLGSLLQRLNTKKDLLSDLKKMLEELREKTDTLHESCELVMLFVETFPPTQADVFLKQFLLSLSRTGCSHSTIKNYRSDINQLFNFTKKTRVEEILLKHELQDFILKEYQSGASAATIQRKLSSLTQFAIWLEKISALPSGSTSWLSHFNKNPEELLKQAVKKTRTKHETKPKKTLYQESLATVNQLLPKSDATLKPAGFISETGIKAKTQDQAKINLIVVNKILELQRKLNKKTNQLLLPFINLAFMLLFFIGLSYFGYQQFFKESSTTLAYPSALTRPNRVLSFQGRLTDTAQNPVTSATNFRFRLYDSGPSIVGGTQLWDSGTCSVTPDQDGIFNVGLGSDCGSEIAESVFSENANVWLQVEVASETLSPRQSIKTVPYALNSETLQGYPPADPATANTVLVMNSSGEVSLGTATPKIKASSGSLTLEGTTLTLQTTSNGNISLSPNGTGNIIASRYISAPGATLSATYAGGTALVARGGPSGTATIQEWQNSSGTALSVVNSAGNLGIGTTTTRAALDVAGNASLSGQLTFRGTTDPKINALNGEHFGISTSAGGDAGLTERFTVLNNGNVGVGINNPSQKLSVAGRILTQGGMLFNQGSGPTDNLIYLGSESAGAVDASFGFFLGGIGSNSASDGGYFLGRGNNFSALANQRGNLYFVAGNPSTPGTNEGSINFTTAAEISRLFISNGGNLGIGTTDPASFKLQVAGSVGPQTTNTYDLGSVSLQWANIYGQAIYQNANQVCDTSGNCTTNGLWQNSNNAFHPRNEWANIADVLVGGNSTASADFRVTGLGNGSTDLAGYTYGRRFIDIDAPTYYVEPGNTSIAGTFAGNVGIGTTGPTGLLEILGTSSPQLKLSYNGSNATTLNTASNGDLTIVPSGGDVNITGTLDVSSTAAIGSAASINTSRALSVDNVFTDLSSANYAGYFLNQSEPTGTVGNYHYGIQGYSRLDTAQTLTSGMRGVFGQSAINASGATVANLEGVYALGTILNDTVATATAARGVNASVDAEDGTITTGYSVYSTTGSVDLGTLGTSYGLYVAQGSTGPSGTRNTQYGLRIASLTSATTDNYGIWGDSGDWILDSDGDGVSGGTGAGGDLMIGESQDLKIYHDGTNSYIDNSTGSLIINGGATTRPVILQSGTGNVGVGTTTATAKLDISGDASSSGSLVFRGSNPSTVDILNGNRLDFQTSPGGDAGLTTRMTIANNGSVGIGSTSPTTGHRLDVNGNIFASGTGGVYSSSNFVFGNSTSLGEYLTSSGNDISIIAGAGTRLYVDGDAGNIGIGTTDPASFKLQVVGSVGPQTTNTYDLGSDLLRWNNVYANAFFQNGNQVCDTSGNCTTAGLWEENNNAFNPRNAWAGVADVLVGGNSTASADFRVTGLGNGSTDLAGYTYGRRFIDIDAPTYYVEPGNTTVAGAFAGNVGIGSTNPSAALQIQLPTAAAESATQYSLRINPTLAGALNNPQSNYYAQNIFPVLNLTGGSSNTLTNYYGEYIDLTVTNGTIDNYYGEFIAAPAGGTITNKYALVTEANAGNIGLGTTTPAHRLELTSHTTAAGGIGFGTDVEVFRGAADRLDLASGDNLNLVSGNIAIGGTTVITSTRLVTAANGAVGAPSLSFNSDADTGFYTDGSNKLQVTTGGTNRMVIDTNGNVGIGTTDPASFKVQVAGSVGPQTNNTYDLGSNSLRWNNVYANAFFQNGNDVCDESGNCTNSGLWQENNNAFHPRNAWAGVADVLVGGNSTASADFRVTGLGNGSTDLAGYTYGRRFIDVDAPTYYVEPGNTTVAGAFAGNVGIGSTNPSAALQIQLPTAAAESATQYSLRINPTLAGALNNPQSNYYGQLTFPVLNLTGGSSNTLTNYYGEYVDMTITNGTVENYFGQYIAAPGGGTITNKYALVTEANAGNIGLGVTDPVHRLELASHTTAAGGIGFGTDVEVYRSAADTLALASGDNLNLVSGNIAIGGTTVITSTRLVTAANGAVGAPSLSFNSDADTGFYTDGSNKLQVTTGGTNRMVIDTNGNVGIGTTDPASFKVQVAGNVGPQTTNTYNLGSVPLQWANIYGQAIYQNANQVCDTSGNCTGLDLWENNNNLINPRNALAGVVDLAIGGNSTASADFRVTGLGNGSTDLAGYTYGRRFIDIDAPTYYVEPGNTTISGAFNSNIGIGTTNPVAKIQIGNGLGTMTSNVIAVEDSGGFPGFSVGEGANNRAWMLWDAANDTFFIDTRVASTTYQTLTLKNGNVGISTTTPTHKFELTDHTTAAGGIGFGTDVELYRSAANVLNLAIGDTFNIASGALQIGGNTVITSTRLIQAANGSAGAPSHSFASDVDTGMSTDGSNKLQFSTGASIRMVIDTNGNVGIGTTDPTLFMLQVAGNVGPNIDSTYNLGSLATAWANIYGDNVFQGGNQVCDTSGNCTGLDLWENNSNLINPRNALAGVVDLAIGGNSTASADFRVTGLGNGSTDLAGYTYGRRFIDIDAPTYYVEPGNASIAGAFASNIGIGTTNPAVRLDVQTSGATNAILGAAFGTSVDSEIYLYHARGTQGSPTAISATDGVGSIYFQGFDTARTTGGRIYGVAAAAWGSAGDTTDAPVDIRFAVAPDGSETLADVLSITSTANVGIGTTNPSATLHTKTAGTTNHYIESSAAGSAATWFYDGTNFSAIGQYSDDTLRIVRGGSLGSPHITLNSSGSVGIGTTDPRALLDVAGNASTSGTLAFRGTTDPKIDILNGEHFGIRTSPGGDAGLTERLTILNNGNVGIGSATPAYKLQTTALSNLGSTYASEINGPKALTAGRNNGSDTLCDSDSFGCGIYVNETLSALGTSAGTAGFYGNYTFLTNTTTNSNFVAGGHYEANTTAASTAVEGFAGIAKVSAGSITVDNIRGGYFEAASNHSSGTATITTARGIWVNPNFANNTAITDLYGIHINTGTLGTGSTATNYYGIYVDSTPTAGTITTGTGLYLTDVTGATTDYGVYQAGADDVNYFAGNVGIKDTTPSYALDVTGDMNVTGNYHINGVPLSAGLWLANGTHIYNSNAANVGIGLTNPSAKLHVHESTNLGGTLGNSQILTYTSGLTGGGTNSMQVGTWLYRDATGSDWTTARVHDGIDVDGSFNTPGTNTKVWWERDPNNNIQSWGDAASTYMTLNAGNLGVGTTGPGEKLHVAGNARISGATTYLDVQRGSTGGMHIQNPVETDTSFARGTLAHNAWWDESTNLWNVDAIGANDTSAFLIPNGGGFQFIQHNSTGNTSRTFTHSAFTAGALMTMTTAGNLGIGTATPSAKLEIDTNSNALGIRLRGTAETNEIGDIFMAAGGSLVLSNANTVAASAYIEMDAEDDQWGFILRDSGIGSTQYGNFYMNDAATDYINIHVNNTNATAGLVIQQNSTAVNVGVSTVTPGTTLGVYNSGESTTLTNITQSLGNAGINIITDYTASAYTPGVFWSTTNNNPTLPKAGIWLLEDGSGTDMYFGTSNAYATGVTNSNIVIDQGGNFGIGTAAPSANLDVNRGSANNGTAVFRGTTNASHFNYSTAEDTYIRGGKATSGIYINDAASGNILMAGGGGNVGIGMTPTQKLDVNGIIGLAGQAFAQYDGARFNIGDLGSGDGLVGEMRFKTNDTDRMTIISNGNVGIGSVSPTTALNVVTAVAAGWQGRFQNSSGSGADVYLAHGSGYGMHIRGWNATDGIYTLQMFNNTVETNSFWNSGRVTLALPSTANVGIGTSTVNAKLNISQQTDSADALRIDRSAAGNTSQVLQRMVWSTDWSLRLELQHVSGSHIQYNWIEEWNNTDINVMSIKNGSIGIRTTSPGNYLDIATAAATEGINIDGQVALTGYTGDQWLRLNQSNSFSSGVYTPGLMRIDGNLQLAGTVTTVSTNANLSVDPNGTGATIFTGNVGMGITPTVVFNVDAATSVARFGNTSTGGFEYGFGSNDVYIGADNSQDGDLFMKNASGNSVIRLQTNTQGSVAIYTTGGTEKVNISTDGTDGRIRADFPTNNNIGLCHVTDGSLELIVDCSSAPTDLAEYFGTSDTSIEAGDLVAVTGQAYIVPDPHTPGVMTSKAFIKKASSSYDPEMIGIISTHPNQVYGGDGVFSDSENPRPVSMAGRVPTKVTASNGAIKTGDRLTASNIPGVAMKATKAGWVVAIALEDYSGSGVGKIISFVKPVWYDPGMSLNSNGEIVLQQNNQGEYVATVQNTNTVLTNIIGAGQFIASKITAGLVTTKNLVVEQSAQIASLSVNNLTIAGQSIQSYVAQIVDQQLNQRQSVIVNADDIDSLTLNDITAEVATVSGSLTTASLETTTLSAGQTQLGSLIADTATIAGNLTADSASFNTLLSEEASISGNLTAESITIENSARIAMLEAQTAHLQDIKAQTADLITATVSGTLYADNIYNFDQKIATALQQPSLLDLLMGNNPDEPPAADPDSVNEPVSQAGYTPSSPEFLEAVGAQLSFTDEDVILAASGLFVEKYLEVNGYAYVSQALGIGEQMIVGNGMQITEGAIAYVPAGNAHPILKIQPTGAGALELMAGLMTLENGEVKIVGNVDVAGTLKTDTLLTNLTKPVDFGSPYQVQVAGISTDNNEVQKSRFEIVNELGSPVATISAEGKASFAGGVSIGDQELLPGGGSTTPPSEAPSSPTQASGRGTVAAGTNEVTIETDKITGNSLITVTPLGSTQNQVLYVKSQTANNPDTPENEGRLVVGFDNAVTNEVQFTWLILN